MFFQAFFRSIGYFLSLTFFANKAHFFCVWSVGFNKCITVMAEKNNISSFWIKRDFFFSIRWDIYKITFDTIKSCIFLFSCCGSNLFFRHKKNNKLVGDEGFEPPVPDSESGALPLGESPTRYSRIVKNILYKSKNLFFSLSKYTNKTIKEKNSQIGRYILYAPSQYVGYFSEDS